MSTLAHGADVRSTLDSLAHLPIDEQMKEKKDFQESLRVWFRP